MKRIKPIYAYPALIILVLLVFYFIPGNGSSVWNESSNNAPPAEDISNKQMPKDTIHSKLNNPLSESPAKNNVMPNIVKHMKELKTDVDQHPKDTLKIRNYADFLAAAHQQDEAIDYYKKILKINPERTDILTSLVFIYFNKNDLNSAEMYLNKILSINKNDLDAMYNLGAVYANKHQKLKAKQIWQNIIAKHPDSKVAQKAGNSIKRLNL